MSTKIYRIQGKFVMGDETKTFIKELKAMKEEDIYEKIYSEFGSKHHIKRQRINIEKIEEISKDDVQNVIINTL